MESPIYERVRQYLKMKRFSVAELASRLDIKQSTLGGKLNGSRELDLITLQMIVELFPKLSAEWLLRGNGDPEDDGLSEELKDIARRFDQLDKRVTELEGEKKGVIHTA